MGGWLGSLGGDGVGSLTGRAESLEFVVGVSGDSWDVGGVQSGKSVSMTVLSCADGAAAAFFRSGNRRICWTLRLIGFLGLGWNRLSLGG